MNQLKPIVEALIFASPEPVTPKTLYKLLEGETKEDVDAALMELRADYDAPRGLQMVEVAGGFQIVTRPELHEWVRKLFHDRTTQKLSGRYPSRTRLVPAICCARTTNWRSASDSRVWFSVK